MTSYLKQWFLFMEDIFEMEGVLVYFVKPVDIRWLVQKIREWDNQTRIIRYV